MHHLKEIVVDGVTFVMIPEELHDTLAAHVAKNMQYVSVNKIGQQWLDFDPEIFNGL